MNERGALVARIMGRSSNNSTLISQWQHALLEVAAQNGGVELALLGKDKQEVAVIRTRLLKVQGGGEYVYIEKPLGQAAAEAVRERLVVRLIVQHGQSRMKATATVMAVAPFRLNDQLRVTAFELGELREVASAQRRSRFRLHTGGMKMPPVKLADEQDRSLGVINAQLHDLSDRGAGVIVRLSKGEVESLVGRTFQITLHLPGEPKPMHIDGRCLRVQDMGSRVYLLGIKFEYSSPLERKYCDRMIQQFCMAQQRNQLRRLRGAG